MAQQNKILQLKFSSSAVLTDFFGYYGFVERAEYANIFGRTVAFLQGWTFHKDKIFSEIKVSNKLNTGNRAKLDLRSDVEKAFKNFPGSTRCGFQLVFQIDEPDYDQEGVVELNVTYYDKSGEIADSVQIVQKFIKIENPSLASEPIRTLASEKDRFWALEQMSYKSFLRSGLPISIKSSATPVLSIIIVTYNQPELILKCLKSLSFIGSVPYELIIVDNASESPTRDVLARLVGARIFLNSKNHHFLVASNQGASKAKGKYLLFLNSDCFIHPFSVETCLKSLSADEHIGAVGAKVLNIDGSVQEAGSMIFNDGSTFPVGHLGDAAASVLNYQRQADYISGAFLMTRADLFKKLGGFDERYSPAYYEDTDYCVELIKHGYQILYNPLAIVTHYLNGSATRAGEVNEHIEKNRQNFFKKHRNFLRSKPAPASANLNHSFLYMTKTKKILFVDSLAPNPRTGGGFPRSNFILNLMVRLGYHVTLFSTQISNGATHKTLDLDERIELVTDIGENGLLLFLKERSNLYDYYWVSRPYNIVLFNNLMSKEKLKIKKHQIIYDSEAIITPRILQQVELGLRAKDIPTSTFLKLELELYKNAGTVVAVTEQDKRILNTVNTNVKKFGHFHTISKGANGFSRRSNFLFIGPLVNINSPNHDSIKWFLQHVWPEVLLKIPKAELTCVGNIDELQLQTLATQRVSFLGIRDDAKTFFDSHRVFIAPTRFAAGLPHKCTEAASMGIPQVITPILAAQLGWTHKKQALIASTPKAFAQFCIELYQNAYLWNQIRDCALELAMRQYDLKKSDVVMTKILEERP